MRSFNRPIHSSKHHFQFSYSAMVAYSTATFKMLLGKQGKWWTSCRRKESYLELYLSMISTQIITKPLWRISEVLLKANTMADLLPWKCFTRLLIKSVFATNAFLTLICLVKDSLRGDFCRESLAWGSLSHQFILPLLGIYEEKSRLFLVSPFMTNGTLIQWRKNRSPGITEIYRMVRLLYSSGRRDRYANMC